jgi:periplasmic divalent cation tolerance protein
MNADYIVVFITAKDDDEAQRIAGLLLEHKQAACVNIINGVNSRFWWENKIEQEKESLLIVKTRASLLEDVIKTVKTTHSYTAPEIIALPVVGGNPDYLDWIGRETAPAAGGD